ncbi:MAG: hypothetical protein ACJ8HJ_22020 [Massilia sp.]
MNIRLIKMRRLGVEIDRRVLKESFGFRGELVVQDVTDQGLRRPVKVARLLQDGERRAELYDVRIVWLNSGRMTLSGFERQRNEAGQLVDFAQSWLCVLE